jgi:osmotically-inducible protein OsmY
VGTRCRYGWKITDCLLLRLSAVYALLVYGAAGAAALDTTTTGVPPDSVITEAVDAVLEWDEAVAAHYIDVATHHGVVVLSGFVDNMLSRDRAERVTASIAGVRAIINNITVRPVALGDRQIKSDITEALTLDRMTDSLKIRIGVNHGFVILEGTVNSYAQKNIVENIVKGVSGVVGIRNDLQQRVAQHGNDTTILALVRKRVANDPLLAHQKLGITVDSGKVSVSGVVATMEQFSALKRKIGEIGGVAGIDLHALKVLGIPGRAKPGGGSDGTAVSDESIRITLNDVFRFSPRLLPFIIEYDVDRGKVFLSGEVDNVMSRRIAERNAASVAGVTEVVNDITVRPSVLREDWELENDVLHTLKWDPYVERHSIDVWVNNGKVYLYGTVDNAFEKEHAGEIVARIRGVTAIANNIAIPDTPAWLHRSDIEIQTGIRKRLEWNIHVDAAGIRIDVVNGIATLSGVVENWKEYLSVLNCAFSGGAHGVQMNLEVRDDDQFFRFPPRYYPFGYPYRKTFGFQIPF